MDSTSSSAQCPRCGGLIEPNGPGICPACTVGNIFGFEDQKSEGKEEPPEDLLDGKYKIGPLLGEGGFGFVYQAKQTHPVQRPVAVKMLKVGAELARFQAEAQALASLDHPGIAKVFDSGVGGDGNPFLVMEYFRGEGITEGRRPLERSLELFMQICDAVQHAHQRGIIHRDLKPSNILVNADGDFRVIDFGIAKATEELLTEKTLLTGMHQFVGTPGYVSPEQAGMRGREVDTRSDIYSLGALLHEMLTSEAPFGSRLEKANRLAEVLRIIQDEEVPAPSGIPKDLAWIVLRALAKDPGDRYPSASEMAQDVRRFLSHEPTEAHGPGRLYRLKKFICRNKAASIAIAGLVAGFALSSYGLLRANEEAKQAQMQAERAEAVVSLINDLFGSADPELQRGSDYTVRQLLDDYNQEFVGKLDDQPEIELSLQKTLACAYEGLGEYEISEGHFRRALFLSRGLEMSKESEILRLSLARSFRKQGRYQDAEIELNALPSSQSRNILLVDVLRLLGRSDESVLLAEALSESVSDQEGLSIVALSFAEAKNYEGARKLARRAMSLAEKRYGKTSPRLLAPCQVLADIEERAGNHEAEKSYRMRAHEIAKNSLPDDHPLRIHAETLATETREGNLDGKVSQLIQSLIKRAGNNPEMFRPLMRVGSRLFQEGKAEEAVDLISKLLKIDYVGLTSGETISFQMGGTLVGEIVGSGRMNDFLPLMLAAHEEAGKLFGNEHLHTVQLKSVLAYMYRWKKDYPESLRYVKEAFELNRKMRGESHGTTLNALIHYVDILWDLGQDDEAVALMMGDLGGKRSQRETAEVAEKLAAYQAKRGRRRLAEQLYHHTLENAVGDEARKLRVKHALVKLEYGGDWFRRGTYEKFLNDAYDHSRKILGRHDPKTADIAFWLSSDRGQFKGLKNTVKFLEQEIAHGQAHGASQEVIQKYAEKLNLRRADYQRQLRGLKESRKKLTQEKDPEKRELIRAKAIDQAYYVGNRRVARELLEGAADQESRQLQLSQMQGSWRVGEFEEARRFLVPLLGKVETEPESASWPSRGRARRVCYRMFWDDNNTKEYWRLLDGIKDRELEKVNSAEVLVPRHSRWFFHFSKTPPRSNWMKPDHSFEMLWRRGCGPFSDYRFPEQCRLPYRRTGRVPAAQFRHHFEVEERSRYDAIRLRLTYPAGVIVYLNGEEVLRSHLPNSVSSAGYGKRRKSHFPLDQNLIELPIDQLKIGKNTLAVQVHRRSDRDALYFDLQLEGVKK